MSYLFPAPTPCSTRHQRPMYSPDVEPAFPSQYTPLSNAELRGALEDSKEFDTGVVVEPSYLGIALGSGDHGVKVGYDTEGSAALAVASDLGQIDGSVSGDLDIHGPDRTVGGSGKLSVGTEVRGAEVSAELELTGQGDDHTKQEVLPSGQVRVTRNVAAVAGGGLSGCIEYFKGGASGELSASRERTLVVDGPVWLATVAREGSADEAARVLIGAQELMVRADDLGNGETYTHTESVKLGGRFGFNILAGPDGKSDGGGSRTVRAKRNGDIIELEVSIASRMHGSIEASVGCEVAGAYSKVSEDRAYTDTVTGRVALHALKDAALIAAIEGCRSPGELAALVDQGKGSMEKSSTFDTASDRATGLIASEYIHEQDGSLTTTVAGGRHKFDAGFSDEHRVDPGGLEIGSDRHRNAVRLEEQEGGGYTLDASRTRTDRSFGYDGLPELDLLSPLQMLTDLVTTTSTVQEAGWELDAVQVDTLIGMAGTDAWQKGCDSRFGGAEDVAWQQLGADLKAMEALPESVRRTSQAHRLARFVADGHDLEALDKVVDREPGLDPNGTRVEWPSLLKDGESRFDDLQERLATEEDPKSLIADVDRFRSEVLVVPGFTMPRARAELLARLNAIRVEATEQALRDAPEADVPELKADQQFADLVTGLGSCRAYAQDQQKMFERHASAHDQERWVQDVSSYYAEWSDQVMNVRRAYEAMGIRPESWQVSAPGAKRGALEPDIASVKGLWSRTVGNDTAGFDRRIAPQAGY
ncbi:MAG: hypothetical protein R3F61_31685 [Myxococcota bacterium]